MKRTLFYFLLMTLVLTISVSPVSYISTAAATSEEKLSQEVGELYLAERTEVFPDWQGAILTNPQAFYDLQDRVIAYLFTIMKDDKPIGSIIVGSSLYDYKVMQAGSSLPPSLPVFSEVARAAEKDLGLSVKTDQIKLNKLVYLGYSSCFGIYTVKGVTIAFNLQKRQAVPFPGLKNVMISPEQYSKTNKDTLMTLDLEYNNLPVPVRNMADPPGYDDNCGPTAGAMIAEYYKQYRGYSNFDDWYTDHNSLYVTMETNQNPFFDGTMPWNWGPGFVAYAAAAPKNYSFTSSWAFPIYNDYASIKYYIDTQRPISFLFWYTGAYDFHYVAVRGYWFDDSGKDFIINDSWGSMDFINWEIYYGGITVHLVYPN